MNDIRLVEHSDMLMGALGEIVGRHLTVGDIIDALRGDEKPLTYALSCFMDMHLEELAEIWHELGMPMEHMGGFDSALEAFSNQVLGSCLDLGVSAHHLALVESDLESDWDEITDGDHVVVAHGAEHGYPDVYRMRRVWETDSNGEAADVDDVFRAFEPADLAVGEYVVSVEGGKVSFSPVA